MGKMSLFTIFLVLGLVTIAPAAHVISIDINNYGNGTAYSGEAAVPGATTWKAYYGGWGVAIGSPRSAGLTSYDNELKTFPVKASTYAAQVWVGDRGSHGYITGTGTGLLDDGFAKNSAGDPNLAFIGLDMFGDAVRHVYGGNFDLYVYGNSAGAFYLTDANNITIAGPLAVTGTVSGFVEGQNYVVFRGVDIANPDSVLLCYTNELNAIQLVSTKPTPKVINPNSSDPNDYTIQSMAWDVAFDTNGRDDETDYGFGSYYGPDTYPGWVGCLDTNDAMEYDISISPSVQGRYNVTIQMDTTYGATTLDLFLDGILVGQMVGSATGPETVGPLPVNLFAGVRTLKWQSQGYYGGNVGTMTLTFQGAITLNNCADVYTYGLQPAGDINGDCRVDLADLAFICAEWASDYNPFAQ